MTKHNEQVRWASKLAGRPGKNNLCARWPEPYLAGGCRGSPARPEVLVARRRDASGSSDLSVAGPEF